jgi:hypothetical protein
LIGSGSGQALVLGGAALATLRQKHRTDKKFTPSMAASQFLRTNSLGSATPLPASPVDREDRWFCSVDLQTCC